MYLDLKKNYWWPGMKKDCVKCVEKCLTCLKFKAEHQKQYGKIQPLEILIWKWEKITMDFVTKLPRTTKKHDLSKIYINEITARHGVPVSIVSNRDGRFTSNFWQDFQEELATTEKIETNRERLKATQDRWKNYADRRRPIEFNLRDFVMLKNTSIGARDTGIGHGKQVNEGSQGQLRHMRDDVDINTLTMEQYLALIQDNIRPSVVKPEIGDDVELEINNNFMRELRRGLFKGTDDEDAHKHVRRVLEIADLFHFPGVTHDVVMLRVFPITLTGANLEMENRLSAGSITTWDLLEKAFIRKYYPPFKTAKQLEEIRKQDMDETLYHAWERHSDLLYRCLQHDLNSQQKVQIFYTGLDILPA
ncbi:ribonuclease H-like domain-containing protein [Tanacetum coccineum]